MNLTTVKENVSNLAVLTTVLLFLSGVLVCKQYMVKRTTAAEASPLRFVCGFVSCFLWFLYGLMKQDTKIILVNIIGLTLMISCTTIFYIYTIKKSTVLKQVILMLVLLITIVGYGFLEKDSKLLLSRFGLLASFFTLLILSLPMSRLLYALRVRHTECLSFPIILISFAASMLWLIYGIILDDAYLEVPSIISAALAASQLTLFTIYPNKPRAHILA